MNRLEKKCFIASAAVHGLLFGVVIFGSAFFVRDEKVERVPNLITMYDASMVTDALTVRGGNPNALQPTANQTQQPPAPKPPEPVKQPDPEPQVEKSRPEPPEPKRVEKPKAVEKTERLTEKDIEPVTKTPKVKESPKPRLDKASLTQVVRKPSKSTSKSAKDDSDEKAEAEARNRANAARRTAVAKFASTVKSLKNGFSSATEVDIIGPGGSAFSAVNYDDLIASKYYNAWVAPNGADNSTPNVLVTITVAKDGSIISARILRRSGNAAMDRSIESVLDNVTFIEPFPEGAKDQQRTFKISFNLEAKRQLG